MLIFLVEMLDVEPGFDGGLDIEPRFVVAEYIIAFDWCVFLSLRFSCRPTSAEPRFLRFFGASVASMILVARLRRTGAVAAMIIP